MITYEDHGNGMDKIVKLDGKVTGYIRQGHWGWRYEPKGTRRFQGEASFSLDVVKRSLEAPKPSLEDRYAGGAD